MTRLRSPALAGLVLMLSAVTAHAQDNYEIQVYGSETMPKGTTMFELHSNFAMNGRRVRWKFGVLPTNHALHETLEITHGFTTWFELGVYGFTSANAGEVSVRRRATSARACAVPTRWGWPLGVSLSHRGGLSEPKTSPPTRGASRCGRSSTSSSAPGMRRSTRRSTARFAADTPGRGSSSRRTRS